MTHADQPFRRASRWVPRAWVLSGLAAAQPGLGCSGPDLTPSVLPEAIPEPPPLVIPEGGVCAPPRLEAQPASPELEGDGEPIVTECEDGAVPTPSQHTPLRPLGIGYQGGENPIPPRTAYLTFDDGPSEWTHQFLDILAERGVKATFFVTSKQLKGEAGLDGTYRDPSGNTVIYRDVLKRIVDDGHVLGNHTVNHPDLARITRAQISSEIEQNELLVNRALLKTGSLPRLMPLFRPPYGSPWYTGLVAQTPPRASERVSSHGLNIMWNITSTDASDWATGESYSSTSTPNPTEGVPIPSYAEKVARVQNSVLASPQIATGQGMIVLMHDTHNATRDALPAMIDGLVAAEYSFETIDHYVEWRWGRPAIDLTPGPSLYQPCVEERNWGCAAFGVPVGTDRAREVCGRMWVAFESLGGEPALGQPIATPVQNPDTGIVSQAFQRAIVELHPENQAPCNVVAIPQ
jgi:peptidoglycan/xylan/chitin deacetylase (PgdA/CDA1 family)